MKMPSSGPWFASGVKMSGPTNPPTADDAQDQAPAEHRSDHVSPQTFAPTCEPVSRASEPSPIGEPGSSEFIQAFAASWVLTPDSPLLPPKSPGSGLVTTMVLDERKTTD